MSSGTNSPGVRSSRRSARTADVGLLGCLGATGILAIAYWCGWAVVQWAPGELNRHLGWPYGAAYYLLLLVAMVLIRTRQYHQRGQTIREGLRADLDRHRRQKELRRQVRRAADVLPWLRSPQGSPADWPGVVITPAPDAPGYRGCYDVVLDAAGDTRIRVAAQVRKLTDLRLADARHVVDQAPAVVLRVPTKEMASAAQAVLEHAGAVVSVTSPAASAS